MKGETAVIEQLNDALKHELGAVNQYWLHYRLLEDWGLTRLAKLHRRCRPETELPTAPGSAAGHRLQTELRNGPKPAMAGCCQAGNNVVTAPRSPRRPV